jgi:hypothetical protein
MTHVVESIQVDVDAEIRAAVDDLDLPQVGLDYWRGDEMIVLPEFLPADVLAQAQREVEDLRAEVKRKTVVGFRRGCALSHYTLEERAPTLGRIYRSPELLGFCSRLSERELQVCPDTDPHATAVYIYEEPGDRIGYHYDISHYRGARYTVLIGIEDDSSARLQCKLYSKEKRRPTKMVEVATRPGTLVFFNGDKLLHAVSPTKEGERRVVFALEYVTDPYMKRWRRVVSKVKDSFGYFGIKSLWSSPGKKRDEAGDLSASGKT